MGRGHVESKVMSPFLPNAPTPLAALQLTWCGMGYLRFLAIALVIAGALPTLTTWLYFVGLATDKDAPNRAQQVAFLGGKIVQFTLPLAVVWLLEKRLPWPPRPRSRGLIARLCFRLLVA